MGDIIDRTDAAGRCTYCNPTSLRTLGYLLEELLGRHYLEIVLPPCRVQAERFYGRQFVRNVPRTVYEVPVATKDGRDVWLGQHAQLLMAGDTVSGFQVVAGDITERKRVEQALRQSEERFSKAFQSSPAGMAISRLEDGRVLDVNDAFWGFRDSAAQNSSTCLRWTSASGSIPKTVNSWRTPCVGTDSSVTWRKRFAQNPVRCGKG